LNGELPIQADGWVASAPCWSVAPQSAQGALAPGQPR
jgi:hypothetical protein